MKFAPACTLCCVFLFGVPVLAGERAEELLYDGHPLSHWIGRLDEGEFDEFFEYWSGLPYDAFRAIRNIGPKAVPALTDALKSDSIVVRCNAAEALEGMGPEARSAVPALLRATDDPNPQVRIKAVEALGAIGPEAKPAIPKLAKLLHHTKQHPVPPHGFRRMSDYARDALVEIGLEALPVFLENVKDKDATVRFQAVEALGNFPTQAETVAPVLLQALDDKEPVVRAVAAEALGRLGPRAKSAAAALARRLDDTGEHGVGFRYSVVVAYRAALALRDIGPGAKDVPALVRTIENRDETAGQASSLESSMWYVRCLAAEMLGDLGKQANSAAPALTAALDDDQVDVAAAAALLRITSASDRARRILIEALEGDDPYIDFPIAVRAIRQLQLTNEATANALQKAVKHEDEFVRIAAAAALLRNQPQSDAAQEVFASVFQNPECDVWSWFEYDRERWMEVLGAFRDLPAVARATLPVVLQQLYSEINREAALEALAAIGPEAVQAVPELIRRVGDERDVDVLQREAAVMALGRLGQSARPAVAALVNALKDNRMTVRAAAAESLRRIPVNNEVAIQGLIAALEDDYAAVRRNAAAALGELGPAAKSAIPKLEELLDDEYKTVRAAATRALSALSDGS